MKPFNLVIYSVLAFLFLAGGCRKENDIFYNPEYPLVFSDDTVKFDTVFTSIGSTTRRVKVFNRSKDEVTIASIDLAGGNTSFYKLNINGVSASSISNFKIKGRDSISLFIRVNIDPNVESTPFIVADSISFSTNGKLQTLQLQAYGQNARFISGGSLASGTVWDKELPYVVSGVVKVPAGATLTMKKGTRVYFRKDAKLEVGGSLKVLGEPGDSVTISSDRKERIYSEVPGQWDGIHFLRSSSENHINYATIKNALIGIRLDSLPAGTSPKLLLTNSILKNMEVVGVLGYNTSIAAFNNLIQNCGKHLIYCTAGGDYNFKQNTFLNNFLYSARLTPSLFFSDAASLDSGAPFSLNLTNNIIWGNNADELFVERKGNSFSQIIENNLIRSRANNLTGLGNLVNSDPLFFDTSKLNFTLRPGSPAENYGKDLSADPYFLLWLSRDKAGIERVFPSELGCYEIF